jgi:hypothetical protein
MKNLLILLVVCSFVSCKEDFRVENVIAKKLDSVQILNSKETKSYIEIILSDKIHPLYVEKESTLEEFLQSIDRRNNIPSAGEVELNAKIDKFVDKYILEMRNKGSRESEQKLRIVGKSVYLKTLKPISEEQKLSLAKEVESQIIREKQIEDSLALKVFEKLKKIKNLGMESKFQIVNNSSEIIESATVTILIKFEFENSTKIYLRSSPVLSKNKTWKPLEKLNVNLFEVLSYAKNYNESIFKHKAKTVKQYIFISANNSVGYNNNAENKNLELEKFGKFDNRIMNSEEIRKLGDEIFSNEITEVWSK